MQAGGTQFTSEITLGYFGRVLRARWPIIVVSGLLGVGLSVAYMFLVPPVVTATTSLNINVIATDPFNASRSASGLLDGTTEAQIANSYAVVEVAARDMNTDRTTTEIRSSLAVTTVADATVMRISYSAPTDAEAELGADSVAKAYLEYRAAQAQSRLKGALQRIEQRSTELKASLVDANSRSAAAPANSSAANQAGSDRELITREIDSLLAQRNELERIDTSGGSILTPATQQATFSAPSARLVAASGLCAGLMLGLVGAFAMNTLNYRLRRAGDVENATYRPVLAELRSEDATLHTGGADQEQMFLTRERLLMSMPEGANVIVVLDDSRLSNIPGVATALALTLAQAGWRCRLVYTQCSEKLQYDLSYAMGLRIVDRDSFGTLFQSDVYSSLEIYLPQPEQYGIGPAAISGRRGSSTDSLRCLTLVSVSTESGAAMRVAAQRSADAAILVVEKRRSRNRCIRSYVKEFKNGNVMLIGAVIVPDGYRIDQLRRGDQKMVRVHEVPVSNNGGSLRLGRPRLRSPSGSSAEDVRSSTGKAQ